MALLESEHHRIEELPSDRLIRDDPKTAAGKVAIFQYLVVAVFIFLVAGFWKLQVQNPDLYSEAAERNRIKGTPVLAPRGKILDRDGRVIVDNKASYSLLLNRDQIKWEHLPAIAEALQFDYGELTNKIRRMGSTPQIIIKDQLTRDEIAFVESHRDVSSFPEMQLIQAWRRQYPQDGFAAHAVGYVGEISESELNLAGFIDYHQGDIIGKDGIERQYDQVLRGVDGQQRVLVDNMGHERQIEDPQKAVPGKDLRLTLDLDLQAVAELAMVDKRGAVVALDPRNGEVLALVSRPAYDPNKFTGRISRTDWGAMANDPYKPLMNRAIQAEFAPGSTFKPFVALAGLESGIIDDKTEFHCPGGASFYGHYFACWRQKQGGHGNISLHRAIAQSCDVFFYNVANKLGIDRIAHYSELAGFGHKTGIDLPNERDSTMPSTRWKMRMFRQKWYAGETISVGIGQGAVTASPLELAAAEGGLAVGGRWFQPHLVKTTAPKVLRTANLNPENVNQIISGMYGVVNEGGTGRFAALPGIKVCGKTGTAQLASNQLLKGTKLGQAMKDNAWFIGFAPEEAPEIVVVALFENGEHGDRAAWIVRDVLKAYFDKKTRDSESQITKLKPLIERSIFTPPTPVAALKLALPAGLSQ
ncbi:MAG: penicillin-binding protein 2 [Bryobacteraceae bacterium]